MYWMKTSSKASGSYCAIGVSGSKIGFELGPKGMANEEIIPFPADAAAAHASVARPTWVSMLARCVTPGTAWRQQAAAHFARAFLRHPALSTRAKRVG